MTDLTLRAFQTPKAGCQPDECEDALAWDVDQRLFAIADGATDSAFQKLWANLLVEGFIAHPPPAYFPVALAAWVRDWLPGRQHQWDAGIPWGGLPWHGLNKARQTGGLATFLGVHLHPHQPYWQGVALGDCNLFHLFSDGEIYDYQPSVVSDQFGITPAALSSLNPRPEAVLPHLHKIGGTYYPGETLLLTTDALAVWLFKQIEANARPWRALLDLRTPADFTALIENLRAEKQIRNDDTSVLIIHIN